MSNNTAKWISILNAKQIPSGKMQTTPTKRHCYYFLVGFYCSCIYHRNGITICIFSVAVVVVVCMEEVKRKIIIIKIMGVLCSIHFFTKCTMISWSFTSDTRIYLIESELYRWVKQKYKYICGESHNWSTHWNDIWICTFFHFLKWLQLL